MKNLTFLNNKEIKFINKSNYSFTNLGDKNTKLSSIIMGSFEIKNPIKVFLSGNGRRIFNEEGKSFYIPFTTNIESINYGSNKSIEKSFYKIDQKKLGIDKEIDNSNINDIEIKNINISTEKYRIYHFKNNIQIKIDNPQSLDIINGKHIIYGKDEKILYKINMDKEISCIEWVAKKGKPNFVK